LTEDDAHIMGKKIQDADALIIGTPDTTGKHVRTAEASF
jgi:hypothetical protein